MQPTVFVIEDDRPFCDALVLMLESSDLSVRAWRSAPAFLDHYRADMPGCVVSDVRMSAMSGLELQEYLLAHRVPIPTIFIAGHADISMAVAALKRGAVDFLEKPFSPEQLLQSVAEALERDTRLRRIEAERSLISARHARLSEREVRVMAMVIGDWSNKEIARALDISPRTVDHHREHVMAKMEARSLSELIVMGLIAGMKELRLESAAHGRLYP